MTLFNQYATCLKQQKQIRPTHNSSTSLYKLQSPEVRKTLFSVDSIPLVAEALEEATMSVKIFPFICRICCGIIPVEDSEVT